MTHFKLCLEHFSFVYLQLSNVATCNNDYFNHFKVSSFHRSYKMVKKKRLPQVITCAKRIIKCMNGITKIYFNFVMTLKVGESTVKMIYILSVFITQFHKHFHT